MKNLKKVIQFALVNKWMNDDHFAGIRFHQTTSKQEFLVEDEITILLQKEFRLPVWKLFGISLYFAAIQE
jgi:hypothetical protein